MSTIRVVVVEDHPVMREATVRFLSNADDVQVVAAFDSVEALLARDATNADIDVVVLDLNLAGMNGIDGLPLITERLSSAATLVLTMSDGSEVRASARAAGARGFLTKGCAPNDLLVGVRSVAAGEWHGLGPAIDRRPSTQEPLDEAEVAVLILLLAGRSVGDIALQLGVSFRQGALLIASIKSKTGCTSRNEWLQYAVDHELL